MKKLLPLCVFFVTPVVALAAACTSDDTTTPASDSGAPDTSFPDTSVADASTPDTGVVDAGSDAADSAVDVVDAAPDVDAGPPFTCDQVATVPCDSNAGHIAMAGPNLFFIDGTVSGNNVLSVYDLSVPTSPLQIGSVALPFEYGHAHLAPGGQYVYSLGGGGILHVIDVSDPTHPGAPTSVSVNATSTGLMDLTFCGNTAYVAVQSHGVAAFDVSNPGAPVFLAESDIPDSGADPYPSGVACHTKDSTHDDIYIGDFGTNGGLRVYTFDTSGHTFATRGQYLAAGTASGHGWAASSTLFYMPWDPGGLAVFDLTNPDSLSAPTLVGHGDNIFGPIFAESGYLFANDSVGLSIFDLSTPTLPRHVYTSPLTGGTIGGMARFNIAGGADSGSDAGADGGAAGKYLVYRVAVTNGIGICKLNGF